MTPPKKRFHFLIHPIHHHLSQLERENLIAMSGMAVEYYTIFYIGYVSVIFSANFLPPFGPIGLILTILASYIIGFFGALFCGHVGDKKGRKVILSWTLALVSLPTLLISILPSYYQIGFASTIIFFVLRSVQVMAFAGDAVGLATFILEDAPKNHRGLFGGFMSMGSAVGVLAASVVLSIFNPLENPTSPWIWRIPLSFGAIGLFIAIYFLHSVAESNTFKHYKKDHYKRTIPFTDLMRFNKLNLLKVVFITPLAPIITVIVFGFIPYLGVTYLGLTLNKSMLANSLSLLPFLVLAPVMGAVSDKIGRKPILYSVSILYLFLSLPLFLVLEVGPVTFYVIQILFGVIGAAYFGVAYATCIEQFPTHVRYTGVALGYSITYALFGGMDGHFLVNYLQQEFPFRFSPIFYLLFGSLVVFITTLFLKEKSSEALSEE